MDNKFAVKIDVDKFNNQLNLSITDNGHHWTSIRLKNPKHEIPLIIFELSKYLRDKED